MTGTVRTSLYRAITSSMGDRFLAVRFPKDIARRVNAMLGEPLCSPSELERRRAGRARLEALKNAEQRSPAASPSATKAEQAPVMIYFEKDRNATMLGRIKEALDAKAIVYALLDVSGDEVTRDFVLREAKCKDDDLPIVFVGGSPVGGYGELVNWDVSGRLANALAGR